MEVKKRELQLCASDRESVIELTFGKACSSVRHYIFYCSSRFECSSEAVTQSRMTYGLDSTGQIASRTARRLGSNRTVNSREDRQFRVCILTSQEAEKLQATSLHFCTTFMHA